MVATTTIKKFWLITGERFHETEFSASKAGLFQKAVNMYFLCGLLCQ